MWNQKVVSYQPANKRIKTLEICGGTDSFHLDTYTESLVLLDAANGVLKKQLSACDGVDSEDGRASSEEEKAAVEAELEHFSVGSCGVGSSYHSDPHNYDIQMEIMAGVKKICSVSLMLGMC
ncbi:unnamed protein product [Camellia sinensis]